MGLNHLIILGVSMAMGYAFSKKRYKTGIALAVGVLAFIFLF